MRTREQLTELRYKYRLKKINILLLNNYYINLQINL